MSEFPPEAETQSTEFYFPQVTESTVNQVKARAEEAGFEDDAKRNLAYNQALREVVFKITREGVESEPTKEGALHTALVVYEFLDTQAKSENKELPVVSEDIAEDLDEELKMNKQSLWSKLYDQDSVLGGAINELAKEANTPGLSRRVGTFITEALRRQAEYDYHNPGLVEQGKQKVRRWLDAVSIRKLWE